MKLLRSMLTASVFTAFISVVFLPFNCFAIEKVSLQLKWKHQFQFAGYYAAKEKGFYKEAGLEVELIENKPGQDSVQSVLEGNADFGVGSTELILKRHKGEPVVVIAVIFQHSPFGLLMLKNDKLQSIHDLAGKKVMIEKGASELFAYLNKEKIPSDKFTLLPHSYQTDDFLSGKVDAMSVYVTDELFEVEKSKKEYILYSPRSVGIDFYGDNLFTTEKLIKESPEVVEAFRKASLKGWEYAMAHPDEIVRLIHSKYSQRHTIEHLEFEAGQMVSLIRPDLVKIGHINPGRWKHIAETYADLGMMNSEQDIEQFIYDPTPVPKDLRWLYVPILLIVLLAILVAMIAFYIFRKNMELKKEISERKQMEKSMRKLQMIIQQKTRLESLGVLAGGIAHDFNNLMAGVFGYVEMALGCSKDEKAKTYLSKAMQSIDKARDLTDQLITFSKGGTPKTEVMEVFPFVKKSIEDHLKGKDVKCSFSSSEGLWKSKYDESQINDVLKNIVQNALDAFPECEISVNCENVEISRNEVHGLNSGNYVKVTISDNGPGMSPTVVSKIFDPFFSTKEGKHGLGLSKCYSIIKQHSGIIDVTSQKGQGTSFFVYLQAFGVGRKRNNAV